MSSTQRPRPKLNAKEVAEKVLENYQGSDGRRSITDRDMDFIVREVVKQIRDKQVEIPAGR